MKRWLLVLVSFTLVVLGAEIAVREASGVLPDPAPWPTNESEVKAAQMGAGGPYDVVLLGTSVTESAVDAAMVSSALGVEVYDAALPFATQQSLLVWMNDFVVPEARPSLIVLGIPSWGSGLEPPSDDDLLLDGLLKVEEFRHPRDPVTRLFRHSYLVRYRTELKELANLLEPRNQLLRNGSWTSRGNQTGYDGRTFDGTGLQFETATPGEVSTVGRLVASARENGSDIAFLFEPSNCDPGGLCVTPEGADKNQQPYLELAREMAVPVIDLPGPWPLSWHADPAHFNEEGTVNYTRLVIEKLRGLLP